MVVWNTCDKELNSEMKSGYENYFKRSLENFQKSLPVREIWREIFMLNIKRKQYKGIVCS